MDIHTRVATFQPTDTDEISGSIFGYWLLLVIQAGVGIYPSCTADGKFVILFRIEVKEDFALEVSGVQLLGASHAGFFIYGEERLEGRMLQCAIGQDRQDGGNAHAVVSAVYPELTQDDGDAIPLRRAVIGLEPGQKFDRAPCCQPLPGERIVGITHRGKGVEVHAIDCNRLGAYENEPERWVDLHWHSGTHPAVYGATLDLTIGNDAGVLGRICTLIGEKKANISNLEFVDRKPDFYRLLINVELRDLEQLHSLMLMLEAESDVAAVERYRDQVKTSVAAG